MRIVVFSFLIGILLMSAARAGVVNDSVSLIVDAGNYTVIYPGGNYTGNGDPFSQTWPFTLQYFPDYVNMSVQLGAGQSQLLSGCYQGNIDCASQSGNCTVQTSIVNGWCNYSNTFEPGQDWYRENNGCYLNFTVNQWSPGINDSYNITKMIYIGKNGGAFNIALDNYTKTITEGWDNATVGIPISYECPMIMSQAVSDSQGYQTYELCSAYFPLLSGWMNMTLNKCFSNYDAYRDYVNTRDAVLATQNQALSDCKAAKGATDGELVTSRAQVVIMQDLNKDQDNKIIILGFICVILFIGICILATWSGYSIHRMSADQDSSSGE